MPDPAPPVLIATIPFAPGAELAHYRLANGLNVYLLPEHAVPVVSVQTWVNVGSRHEVPGKTGLAHFFEHLMFGETAAYGEGDFTARLEAIGAEINAATYYDWTHYYVNARASALADVLDLEVERLAHLAVTSAAIDREREVVANERRMRVEDSLMGAAMEQLYALAYTVHAYGHTVIGTMADIEAYNPADCQAFYRTYYAPNNVTLVLVGDFEVDAALALIAERYGPLATAAIPMEDVHPEPPQIAERRAVLTKPTASERLLLGYHAPADRDVDAGPLAVLLDCLIGGDASLLHQALVETERAAEVSGWLTHLTDPDLLCFYLEALPGEGTGPLLARFDADLATVAELGVSADRLAQSQAKLSLGVAQSLRSASNRASAIGVHVVGGAPMIPPVEQLRQIAAVTLNDLLRVARRYLTPSSRSIVQIVPTPEEISAS